MENDREFLTTWLLESTKPELLDDNLDEAELNRMSFDQLFELAEQRQKKLGETAEKKRREMVALRKYGMRKFRGIRAVK